MSARTRLYESTKLADVPADDYSPAGQRLLQVDLMYIERKGYVASANVIERCGHVTKFSPFSGASVLIEPAARFNAKRLASIVVPPETVESLKRLTLERNAPKAVRS